MRTMVVIGGLSVNFWRIEDTRMTFTPRFPGRPPGSPPGGGGGSGPGPRPFRPRFQERDFGNDKDEHRLNERIRVPEVRLIDENGGQVGIVKTFDALRMAREKGLDLMEVAPDARPPVCKIVDYGKFKYEQKKKENAARKKQAVIKVKEVQFRPTTDTHDVEVKTRHIQEFLEDGDKVKITIQYRGREITHMETGRKILDSVLDALKDHAVVESAPLMEGKKMIIILAPAKKKPGEKAKS